MKWQQYASWEVGQRQQKLVLYEIKVRNRGVLETGSVSQGGTDHRMVGPHTLDRSSDHHKVHHKHRNDQCNVGWQAEGHHTHESHKGHHRRDGHRKGDRHKDGQRTDRRSGRCTADLGKDCMDARNNDRHRVEGDDGGTRVPPVVSSGWTGPVCTQSAGRRSCHGRSLCRSSVQGPCPPATFCKQSSRSAPPAPASSSPARRP